MFVAIAIIIVALIVAVAMQPTAPKPQGAQKGDVPEVKDGKRIVRVYGTLWINDPMQLAMKQTGSSPIRR